MLNIKIIYVKYKNLPIDPYMNKDIGDIKIYMYRY